MGKATATRVMFDLEYRRYLESEAARLKARIDIYNNDCKVLRCNCFDYPACPIARRRDTAQTALMYALAALGKEGATNG